MLKIFDIICNKHHINYWLEYGTLLGAIRQANYFLCEVVQGSSLQLADILLWEYNILIKDCAAKAGFNGNPL